MNHLGLFTISTILLALVYSEDLQMTADTYNVINGITESVQFTCRAPQLDENVNLIILLQVDKMDYDVITPIASERTAGTVLMVEDNRISAEGALSGENGTFLNVSIDSPEFGDTGKYQCRFAYFNMAEFKFTLLSQTIEFTFTEPEEPTPTPPPVVPTSCSCDEVWAEVKSLRETLMAENRELKSQLKFYDDTCRVSFSAQFADISGTEFISNQPVVFDSVVSNKGEAYDTAKGIFTAPCGGQYYFRLSLRTEQENDSGFVDAAIEVNGEAKAKSSVFSVDRYHYEQAANGVVMTLAEGDEVQIRINTNSAGQIKGGDYSVFTGFFISP